MKATQQYKVRHVTRIDLLPFPSTPDTAVYHLDCGHTLTYPIIYPPAWTVEMVNSQIGAAKHCRQCR